MCVIWRGALRMRRGIFSPTCLVNTLSLLLLAADIVEPGWHWNWEFIIVGVGWSAVRSESIVGQIVHEHAGLVGDAIQPVSVREVYLNRLVLLKLFSMDQWMRLIYLSRRVLRLLLLLLVHNTIIKVQSMWTSTESAAVRSTWIIDTTLHFVAIVKHSLGQLLMVRHKHVQCARIVRLRQRLLLLLLLWMGQMWLSASRHERRKLAEWYDCRVKSCPIGRHGSVTWKEIILNH